MQISHKGTGKKKRPGDAYLGKRFQSTADSGCFQSCRKVNSEMKDDENFPIRFRRPDNGERQKGKTPMLWRIPRKRAVRRVKPMAGTMYDDRRNRVRTAANTAAEEEKSLQRGNRQKSGPRSSRPLENNKKTCQRHGIRRQPAQHLMKAFMDTANTFN